MKSEMDGAAHSQPGIVGRRSKPGADAAKPRPTLLLVLEKLDAVDDSKFRNRRGGDRIRYRRLNVPVRVNHPGGSTSNRILSTRNLSPSGIGFIYDSFLHAGTQVTLVLQRALGGEDEIAGKVVYCSHISGRYHSVGVRFDQKIFVKLYAERGDNDDPGTGQPSISSPSSLTGRVLVIDAQPMDRALVAHHVRDTRIHVTTAPDVATAVAAISASKSIYDIVLCEADVESGAAESTVNALRAAGHNGRIIAAAELKATNANRERARNCGASGMVSKPYDRTELLRMFAEHMPKPADPGRVARQAMTDATNAVQQGVNAVNKLVDVARSARPA